MKKTFTYLMLSACIAISAKSSAQLSETFESTTGTALPTGWTQNVTPTDSTGWNSGDNTTLGSTNFGMNAHTRFAGVNDDGHQNAANGNELLISPSFNVPSGTPFLSFDCCYLGGTYMSISEAATVEISTDGGTTWTIVSTLAGNAAYWWEPRYISLSAYAGMSNVKLGFRYKDNAGWLYGFCIDNVNVFNPPANDLGLTSIAPVVGTAGAYGMTGTNITMSGTVFNYGATAVTSYTVSYLFNGGGVVTTPPITGTIAPFASGSFSASPAVTLPATTGAYPIQMWVNLTGDANASNDTSAMDTLTAVSFMPTKKLAIEEATGTWCGWCVRGIVYMDSLRELYGNGVSLVAVHNSDPMTVAAYDTWMGTQISGYPSVVIDRSFTDDPQNLLSIYNAHHSDFGFADITLNSTWTTSSISVVTTVKPALDLNGDYRLVLVLTEDGVHGPSGGTWDQHNYYSVSSNNLPLTGQGVNYQDSTNPIPGSSMYYHHVARVISPSVSGTAGVLPSSMTAGTNYSATLTASIPSGDNINYMHAIVMLINNANGHVLNTQNVDLTLGVSNANTALEGVVIYPNPAVNNATVEFGLHTASTVSIEVSDVVGRVVYSVPAAEYNAGAQHISISTADLTPGIYNVKIQTENGVVTQHLTVAK